MNADVKGFIDDLYGEWSIHCGESGKSSAPLTWGKE
jgi:hypothetical protein